jgi:hypothetical protein
MVERSARHRMKQLLPRDQQPKKITRVGTSPESLRVTYEGALCKSWYRERISNNY